MTDDYDDCEKITFLLIGNFYAGRTLKIEKFLNNKCLTDRYKVGIQDFYKKKISINQRNFCLLFFIPTSSERFRLLPRSLFKQADICIFVFDINDEYTFSEIKNFWFPQLENFPNNNLILALVGNESNLSDDEKIDDSEIINYAKSINVKYFKVSAKTGEGIKELFEYLIKTFCELNDKKQNENKNKIIKIEKKDIKEKKKKFFK